MTATRRDVLAIGLLAAAGSALMPNRSLSRALFAPCPGKWTTYDVITRLEIPTWGSPAQAWIPVPSLTETDWVRLDGIVTSSNGRHELREASEWGAKFVHVEWSGLKEKAIAEVSSRVALQDRAVHLLHPVGTMRLSEAEHRLYSSSNQHIPLDGIVKQTSDQIVTTKGAVRPLEKARAIYEWMVQNTYRDGSVRGCGTGDVVGMLQSGKLGGKCADLNALFVGLVRAQGIPARDIYGIRLAPSAFGYKSLGANTSDITKAQHCRSEVFLEDFGWVPMDPADVRKVALEESPGHLSLDNPLVQAARNALLGSSEGNWMPYNVADYVPLPGAGSGRPTFLMYPEAETAVGRLDCLDPATFAYTITSKKLA